MDALNKLVGALGHAQGLAVGAFVAAASLAVLGALAGPAWEVAKALVAAGSGVMATSGTPLVLALGGLCAAKYLSKD